MTATAPSLSGTAEQPTLDDQNPWPGLLSYRERDHAYYRGRKAETEELLRRIRRSRLTVFYSPSGLGKTSLLQAGLFPLLRQEALLPVPIRILYAANSDPAARQVREAIKKAATDCEIEAPPFRDSETLWESFHRREADFWSRGSYPVTPVLVFDQFEETFTLGPARGENFVREFVRELADLIEGRVPAVVKPLLDDPDRKRDFDFDRHRYKVVLTLREDYLPDLLALRQSIPSLRDEGLRLLPMTGRQAREEVVAGSGLVEEGVDQQIIRVVTGAGDTDTSELPVELALVSLVCKGLNDKRLQLGRKKITADLLQAGTGEQILTDFYEQSFQPEWPAEVRYFVEEQLVTKAGTRDSVAIPENLPPCVTDDILSALVSRRLARVEERGGRKRLELTHDVLTKAIAPSRDLRHEREAKARAEEEKLQAKKQAEVAHRQRNWAYGVAALVAVLMVGAAWGAYVYYSGQRKVAHALADADVRYAAGLAEADKARALPSLARALRVEPENVAARALLLDVLLRRRWPLPVAVMQHRGAVYSASFSPDGRWVVTASDDSTARVWDAATGRPRAKPLQHADRVRHAEFSPDGRRVVTASWDNTAQVWDAATGQKIGDSLRHKGLLNSATFSPDGRWVVTASDDSTARVWNAATGRPRGEPLQHNDRVRTAAFSSDGRWVVTASDDYTARVWDAATGRPHGEPLGHRRLVMSAAFSPDGHRVVTASWDSTARVWEVATGRPLPFTLRIGSQVMAVAFSADGRRVVTAADHDTAQVWDAETGEPVGRPLRHRSTVHAATFSPDARWVVTASHDRTARVWDAATGLPLDEPLRHEGAVRSARFSPDGRRVVTASDDGTARVWEVAASRLVALPLRHAGAVRSAAFSPDGRWVVTASEDSTARVWDAATGRARGEPLRHSDWVRAAAFSPDGRWVVTASRDNTARVWDAATGLPRGKPLWHRGEVMSAAFSPDSDGRWVVTASQDGTAQVWEAATSRPRGDSLAMGSPVYSAAFSPDGQRVVTASRGGFAHVWNAATSQPVGEWLWHEGTVYSAVFSRDGTRLVTASFPSAAWIWDLATSKAIGAPLVHEAAVRSAVFNPSGTRVVTASDDGTAQVWDAATGRPVGEPLRHTGPLNSATFSPDGRWVVTASDDSTARVWEAATGQPVGEPLRHRGLVWTAVFSPDGGRVVTASADGTARIWDLPLTSSRNVESLALLAEAVGGQHITDAGTVVRISDPSARLNGLRAETARQELAPGGVLSLIQWFLADPCARTISPFSKMTVAEYLDSQGSASEADAPSCASPSPLFMTTAQLPSCTDQAPRDYRLRFDDFGYVYLAHLSLEGCNGTMYVRYRDRTSGRTQVVLQLMHVVDSLGGVLVRGKNPRDSTTGLPHPTYQADNLMFRILPDSQVDIVNCDQGGHCYPVYLATTILVENRCHLPLTFAAVYADAVEGAWMRRGWWTVQPDSTLATPIQTFADYVFAYGHAGTVTWSGTNPFSVDSSSAFRVRLTDALPTARARSVGFQRIDLSPRRLEYTHLFECR